MKVKVELEVGLPRAKGLEHAARGAMARAMDLQASAKMNDPGDQVEHEAEKEACCWHTFEWFSAPTPSRKSGTGAGRTLGRHSALGPKLATRRRDWLNRHDLSLLNV